MTSKRVSPTKVTLARHTMPNPWDSLSEHFNGKKDLSQIDTDAADNILIAWPVIIEQINTHFTKQTIGILDYGCGAGAFCEKLRTLGYRKVVGMDNSAAMIQMAKINYGDHARFVQGTAETPLSLAAVEVITGIMVFQFIADIERTLANLLPVLKPGGLLIFAVHNPDMVTAALKKEKLLFSDFESSEHPAHGLIHLGGISIPIFIRTAKEYDALLYQLGMTKVLESYPPFTKEFLAQYTPDVPDVPEYLILGYRKNRSSNIVP